MSDHETAQILFEQKELADLVGHRAWPIAREKFKSKVLDLQNAFNIEDGDEKSMVIDLKARKIATSLLFEFWKELEGMVSVAKETEKSTKPSYILNMDEVR